MYDKIDWYDDTSIDKAFSVTQAEEALMVIIRSTPHHRYQIHLSTNFAPSSDFPSCVTSSPALPVGSVL